MAAQRASKKGRPARPAGSKGGNQVEPMGTPLAEEETFDQAFLARGLIEGLTDLPVLPRVWKQIMERLEDYRSSAKDLEVLIRQDQSLCSRVLAAANSAYYGFAHQVTTVQRATLVLGFDELRRICLGAGLGDFLKSLGLKKGEVSQRLWWHSLAVAEASGMLGDCLLGSQAEETFTAGLLHDLGKMVLAARLPRAYTTVREMMRRRSLSWLDAEEMLGLDHQDLGLLLAERWGLPPLLAEVIARHHQPFPDLGFWRTVAVVHLADWLAHDYDQTQGTPHDPRPPGLNPVVVKEFGLDPEQLGLLKTKLAARLKVVQDNWPGLL